MPMAAFRFRRLAPATTSVRRCERSASVIPGREQSERARNLEVPGSIFELGFTRVRRIWLSKSATADLDAHRLGTTTFTNSLARRACGRCGWDRRAQDQA